MVTGPSFSKSELSLLWNRRCKRYTIKSFIENGHWTTHLVLNDKCSGGTAIGKLVKRTSEEFRQRPWLHHRNLASLTDMVTIHDDITVFISVHQQKSLRDIVHDKPFLQSSNCFDLKKIYIEDVLWGLDYLHRNGLCLMNLSDANVFICEQPNKAIITDFGSLAEAKNEGECQFVVPFIHQPPEIRKLGTQFDRKAAEIWVTGMMVLEIFTKHQLPWALVSYDPDRVQEMIAKVDYDILKIANTGSTVSLQDLCEFKTFVGLLIDDNPQQRCSPRDAVSTAFLQSRSNNGSFISPRSNKGSIISHRSNNGSEKNESVSFLSLPKIASNFKQNSEVLSDSSNKVGQVNSAPKSAINIDSLSHGNINFINEIKPLSKIKSKASMSSQVDRMSFTSEKLDNENYLNSDMPTSECSNKSQNEGIEFIPMGNPFVAYNFPPELENRHKNITDCASSYDNCEGYYRETEPDNFCPYRMLPNDLTRNIIDAYNRKLDSVVDVNNSLQKERFPVSKNCLETCCLHTNIEAKIQSGNPYTECEKHFPSLQNPTANVSDLIAETKNIIKHKLMKEEKLSVFDLIAEAKNMLNIELKKELGQEMRMQSEQIKEQNGPLVNNIKTENMPVTDCKYSSQPPESALNLAMNKIPYEQTHVNNEGPNQRAKLSIKQKADFLKKYTSENKCKKCDNFKIEPEAFDKTSENSLTFLNCRTSTDEYWFPTLYDPKKSPTLSSSLLSQMSGKEGKQSACGTLRRLSYKQAMCKEEDLHKNDPAVKEAKKISGNEGQNQNGSSWCSSTDEYWFRARMPYEQRKSPTLSPSPLSQMSGKDGKQSACGNPHRSFIKQVVWKGENWHKNKSAIKKTEKAAGNEGQKQNYPNSCSSTDEYWFPARILYERGKFPILSPRHLSQISGKDDKQSACGNLHLSSYNQAIWKGEDLHKNNGAAKETGQIPGNEDQQQKVIVICSPSMKNLVVDELEQKKRAKYTKKNNGNDALKKCKKPEKKLENPYASTECILEKDSGDEKKTSKKMRRLKKCFCIGK